LKKLLPILLVLYASVFLQQMAKVTSEGDQSQLKWIDDGRKGQLDRMQLFKSYSKTYIDELEKKLILEKAEMNTLSKVSNGISILSLAVCFLLTIMLLRERKFRFVLEKNDGFYVMMFSLFLGAITYFISIYFLDGKWLSPNESQDLSSYYIVTIFFLTPNLLGLSFFLNKKELEKGWHLQRWKYRLSLYFLILSLSAVAFILLGLLITPDLSGNIT
jgi:hypothetical protein